MLETKTIITLIERIIRSWLEEDYDFLKSCLDENVVMCLSPAAAHSVGREAVCESLRRLNERRIIKRYDQGEFNVNIIGNDAIAFYRYRIEYDEGNIQCSESGFDFYVFKHHEKKWRLRWRSVCPTGAGVGPSFDAIAW